MLGVQSNHEIDKDSYIVMVKHSVIHQFFDAVDVISVQGYDEERNVVYWNYASELLYGYSKQEALGQKLENLIIPDHLHELVISAHQDWLNKGTEIPAAEVTLKHKNGQDVSVFSSHVLFCDEKTNAKTMYCIDINLAEAKHAEAQVVFKDKMLQAVFESTPDLFFLMEEDGTIIDYHSGNDEKLLLSPTQFLGKSMLGVLPAKVEKQYKKHIAKVMKEGGVASFEYELEFPHGVIFFEARINHLKAYKQVVVIVRDITEQHKSAEVIRQHAYFDALTSLPNRFLSLDRLSKMLDDAKRNAHKTAVFFMDLDDFKKVNDSLGHEVGEKLLVEAAKRLKQAVRQTDTVGRLGGDEFIVLLSALDDDESAMTIANHILNIFRKPFCIDGRELILSISIGISIYPDNGDCASVLLRNADTAMYQAKAYGRNAYSCFTKEMNVKMTRRFEIEEQMHNALERQEFTVYYQPKLDIKTSTIVGAEALLRWNNPKLGNIRPDEFIPIAENTGLIVDIGEYVINEALSFLQTWQQTDHCNYTMAVNLSPRQFRNNELVNYIKQCLVNTNIAPKNVELEITEGVLMIGKSSVDKALNELKRLGIKLSMDDFGTGYSSLSYLRQYDFDVLKIDRSFISGITLNKADCDLVKAAIAMAHSLGLQVVAEGVELSEQLKLLEDLACDIAQGFYFSEAVQASKLLAYSAANIDTHI